MARARRTMNRMDLREQAEAAERLEGEEMEDEDEEAEDEEEASADDLDDDDDGEAKPKKKKTVKAKKVAKPRTRAAKIVRMKYVWGVFNNSNQRVETFPYNQKAEAEVYIREKNEANPKLMLFLQPVKEPLDQA